MKIVGLELLEVRLPLRVPFSTVRGSRRERRILLVRIEGEDGGEGWGECVAGEEPTYTYETTDTAWLILTELILPRLTGLEILGPEDIGAAIRHIRGHPMARATVEMALWDLQARELGVPLWELLGGSGEPVPVGVAIGFHAAEETLLDEVERRVAEGYARVKLKIGPGRDVETVGRVRERFPDLPLMVDGGAAYRLADAARLKELDVFGLTMIEQPLGHEDLLDHAHLQREMQTPICLDESIRSEGDALLALEIGACRVVNIKPGRVGGHASARAIHDICLERKVPVWCGGMLELGIGRAHNLALATLAGFSLPGDISESRRYWERDVVRPEHSFREGKIGLPPGAGIAVEPDLDRLADLTVRAAVFGSPGRLVARSALSLPS